MPFQQTPLPYAYNALEPSIDARTMEIHYSKHHVAYITNLNTALEHVPANLQGKPIAELLMNLDSVPEQVRMTVRNNGGGHANHTLFWEIMAPNAGGEPGGELGEAIRAQFGSFEELRKQVKDAGMKRFGSGWSWLVAASGGGLSIVSTPNQDTPVMEKKHPILGVDVWEHAYYLLYQNRRADYLDAWWNVVNWGKVAELYAKAKA